MPPGALPSPPPAPDSRCLLPLLLTPSNRGSLTCRCPGRSPKIYPNVFFNGSALSFPSCYPSDWLQILIANLHDSKLVLPMGRDGVSSFEASLRSRVKTGERTCAPNASLSPRPQSIRRDPLPRSAHRPSPFCPLRAPHRDTPLPLPLPSVVMCHTSPSVCLMLATHLLGTQFKQ